MYSIVNNLHLLCFLTTFLNTCITDIRIALIVFCCYFCVFHVLFSMLVINIQYIYIVYIIHSAFSGFILFHVGCKWSRILASCHSKELHHLYLNKLFNSQPSHWSIMADVMSFPGATECQTDVNTGDLSKLVRWRIF